MATSAWNLVRRIDSGRVDFPRGSRHFQVAIVGSGLSTNSADVHHVVSVLYGISQLLSTEIRQPWTNTTIFPHKPMRVSPQGLSMIA